MRKTRSTEGDAPEPPVLERFSDRAREYVAHRPDYPAEAIDALFAGLGPAGALSVADIGAGTGISARIVAERGCQVFAVEPNRAMREAATAHSRISWVEGTGEHTILPGGSVDVVLCAQSFHWMKRDEAFDEFRRILRARGRVALLWNIPDHSDAFTREYAEVVKRCAIRSVASPSFTGRSDDLAGDPRWAGVRTQEFPHGQALDLKGLIGRAVSSSYSPKEGPMHGALVAGLTEAFKRHEREGAVSLRYRTVLHTAFRA